MKTENRVWAFTAFLIALSLVLLCAPAWATKPQPPKPPSTDVSSRSSSSVEVGSTNVSVPVTTGSITQGSVSGGDVTVGGDKNRAYALSNTLGDVDIAGCLGSTQWNTPLYGKQKLVLNWPCMAEFYLRNQMYENAAMAICNTEIRKEFATEEECRAAHPFKAMAAPAPMPTESEDEDDEHERLKAEIAALQDELKKTRVYAKDAQRVAYNVAQAPPQVTERVIVEQRPLITREMAESLKVDK